MFTKSFWEATAERAISTAAQAAVAVVGSDVVFNALDADWKTIGSVALGGGLLSILKAVAAGKLSPGDSPSFTPKAEVDATFGK